MSSEADLATQATCNDASMCKKYAVQRGYWRDPFIGHMVRSSGSRRAPEISRGYYARTEAVWQLLKKFVAKTNGNCQIVSLGAGLDTTFWRLQEKGSLPLRYVELDFANVTAKKVQTIQSKAVLKNILTDADTDIKFTSNEIISKQYSLFPVDLRDLEDVKNQLKKGSIDFAVPTLFLAECVLVYMPSQCSNAIIAWVAESFENCVFINYEQVNMDDRFGKVMIENLRTRDCDLPGVDVCASIDTQQDRFLNTKWQKATCITMWSAYNLLPQADVQRIEKLEFMDERELLEQLLAHYCICWASKESSNIGLGDIEL